MRLIFAGTPQVAVPSLRALLDSDHEVVAVVTRPDARVGRGRRLEPSPVKVVAEEAGLADRVRGVQGDAQDMLFRDGFADLVVSRGSIFFWPDPDAGIRESYRILKPGGVAFVGGGFSRLMDPDTLDELVAWAREKRAANPDGFTHMDSAGILERADGWGIEHIRIIDDGEFEWWVEMRK